MFFKCCARCFVGGSDTWVTNESGLQQHESQDSRKAVASFQKWQNILVVLFVERNLGLEILTPRNRIQLW